MAAPQISDIIHIVCIQRAWRQPVFLFDRYGVLLPQRSSEVTDREHTLALVNMVGAEEGQYQLGLTKVPNCLFMLLISQLSKAFNVLVILCVFVCFRCSSKNICTSSWRRSGAALRPGLLSPSRGTSGASSAGGTSGSSNRKPSSSRATSEDTRPGTDTEQRGTRDKSR